MKLVLLIMMIISIPVFAEGGTEKEVDCKSIKLEKHIGYCASREFEGLELERERLELKVIEHAQRLDEVRKDQGYDPNYYSRSEKAAINSKEAFEAYRAAECDRRTAISGRGSLVRAERTMCQVSFTKRRIELLKNSLEENKK